MWLGWKQVFFRPLFAGALIGLGGAIYLTIGGIVGAVAFAFGLMGVIHYGAPLYTGMAGFINVKDKFAWIMLLITLIGNFIGCWLLSLVTPDTLTQSADAVMQSRLDAGWWTCILRGIGCGFIMTTAVEFARKGKMLPLVLGVPVFILCGFAHSIADAFYFLVSPAEQVMNTSVLMVYISEVMGNFVGCNLYRWTTICVPKN